MELKVSMPNSVRPIDVSNLLKEGSLRRLKNIMLTVMDALGVVGKSVSSGSLRRTVMAFDQLNRLSKPTGSKGEDPFNVRSIAEFLTAPDGFRAMVQQLKEQALELQENVMRNSHGVGDSLQDAASRGSALSRTLRDAAAAVQELASQGITAQGVMGQMGMGLYGLGEAAQTAEEEVKNAWYGMGNWFRTTVYAPIKTDMAGLWDGLVPGAQDSLQQVKTLFQQAGSSFSKTFTDAWNALEGVFSKGGSLYDGMTSGVLTGFKGMVNRLIGGMNQMVVLPFNGINEAFSKLKSFSIGGMTPFKNLNFTLSMPQIPYLAQGAVLPANKPFMAVVGDQKHGTNIEAPLDVIRQAVAEVMEDSVAAQLAGHSATVEVLKQILEAVLGISLDDGTVAAAVERHQQRLSVMRGGF